MKTEKRTGRRFAPRELADEETRDLLRRAYWGMLAVSDDGAPYAVPVAYGWDGEHFYVAMGAGRKADALERNPRVCLTVAEVPAGRPWLSAVVQGRIEWVRDPAGWLRAMTTLVWQTDGEAPRPSLEDAKRLAHSRVIRIIPESVTGRARGVLTEHS